MGTLRRLKGVRGQPGVKCGPKGRQWTPLIQRLPNWCHTWCLTCSRVFCNFLSFFNFSFQFLNNNDKCALKIPASEVVQFSKDSDGFFVFLNAKFFLFTFEKKHVCVFFQKRTKKIWQLKNWNCHLNLWRIAQLLMRGFLMRNFHYCLKIKIKMKKTMKKNWKPLLHVRHQVWHQFGGLWVRGVHWRPLGPHLTPGCPMTPLNLLKVPTEIPWF